ncbi:MAG: dopamine receptor D4 [Mycobacterium sp.]
MRFDNRITAWTLPVCMAGAAAAMILAAPTASAEPIQPEPIVPGEPLPAPGAPVSVDAPVEIVAAPPVETPHLTSPENLPPGTSAVPVGPPEGQGLSYLRELWHAVQTQDVSGGDALLLLTQRPLDPNAPVPAGALPEAVPPGQVVDPAAVPAPLPIPGAPVEPAPPLP